MCALRFLADHDFNKNVLRGLERLEPAVDITRLHTVLPRDLPDWDVLEYAAMHRLVVLSHDVNTMTAAFYGRMESGLSIPALFVSPQSRLLSPVIHSLLLVWSASEYEDWQGGVIYLPV